MTLSQRTRTRILFFLLFLAGCQTSSKALNPFESSVPESSHSHLETIAILGTNDLHGELAPTSLTTREPPGVDPIPYQTGGAPVLARYIQILRDEFKDRFLWLDAGDQFQGSIESNLEKGAAMVSFFNQARLTASAVGNHEFDFGIPSLKQRMTEALYPYLTSNIFDRQSQKQAPFPHNLPHFLVRAGGLQVGIIGLTTLETPAKTMDKGVLSLDFEPLRAAVMRESRLLRDQGAQIILVTAHAGLRCSRGRVSSSLRMRKPTDLQGQCNDQDEITQLVHSLPTGTIDAVVSGHSHTLVHHWISGVPVIQGGAFGRYTNIIYLTYDWSQKQIVPEMTRIEGPIPVCRRVFKNQNDCNGERAQPKEGRGPLVPFRFHGMTVEADPQVQALVEKIELRTLALKSKNIGFAARPIDHPLFVESPLANLTADAIRHAAQADFGLINAGGMRAPLDAGHITFGEIFRSFPFENAVAVLKVKLAEIRSIFQVLANAARGFGGVSQLQVDLLDSKYPSPVTNLNPVGMSEDWEPNRVVQLRLPNGSALDENRYYTLATSDFLARGGDRLQGVISHISEERIQYNTGTTIRDALVNYIGETKTVNSIEQPLVNPQLPRLRFVKLEKAKPAGKKSSRHITKKKKKRPSPKV